ncbi:HIT domain-containing protein [Labilibaculum sp. A4]|uniref:HIT domain-containing protein n=1 Tax=Labilibaculum euxinus TaxID=2686357 RepID=A0A425YD22_9BACT|nr:HIT family protein [Labilibaculum euxinus]MDQ1769930.1 HIT family protein [Labilibaculum euxinus]MUP37914.1 HIT domain-containing protein [Labilibaculum euxinus]MVB07119.1 HIT domain-containing protein [Labilibaculum euxinus]MWN76485.1 HIT domain-containing protein [Labilibaculum euxinus]
MASIFTKIVNGEIPCHKIAEDENFFAFLDISPLALGHTLVIPKQEVDYIFDLDDDVLTGLNLFAKRVAKAVEKTIECKRIGIAVIGIEVPHTHIHLVPINNVGDLNFANPKLEIASDKLAEIAAKIRENFK